MYIFGDPDYVKNNLFILLNVIDVINLNAINSNYNYTI